MAIKHKKRNQKKTKIKKRKKKSHQWMTRSKTITASRVLSTNSIRSCNSKNWELSLEILFWTEKVIRKKISIKSSKLNKKLTEDSKSKIPTELT